MKRLIIILSIICVFGLAGFIFIKPVILFIAKKQLQKVFVQSQVSIGRCSLERLHRITFFDVEINKQNVYKIPVKEVDIKYNLFSILKSSSLQYSANLKFEQVDIDKLVQDFKFRKKFDMTGKLSGNIELAGQGTKIAALKGRFVTLLPGGTLTITDTQFLANMARDKNILADLLVENFKDYHYNNGLISFDLEDSNIVLKIDLDGPSGKRKFDVVLHNFKTSYNEKKQDV